MSDTADIIRMLRARTANLTKQEQESTTKLTAVITDPEHTFISSFDGERFLELPALREEVNRLTKALARLDEGDIDQEEWFESIKAFYVRQVTVKMSSMPSSTSAASNRMEDYSRIMQARTLEALNGVL